ncbi:MAG TPA: hypothetical protein VG323_13785 [Thermoanaerobaculia bacterium]|nr:hypothetical protein [Thermoanaerobaculia bacterium]
MVTLLFLLYSLTFAVHTDQGPTVDPNGNQLTVHSDEGPGMCPHGGGKSPTMYAHEGPIIDPNG